MNGHGKDFRSRLGHGIFGTSDSEIDRVMTLDTSSDTHMSENLGHGFELGHDFGHDFGHGESELHGMNVAKTKD